MSKNVTHINASSNRCKFLPPFRCVLESCTCIRNKKSDTVMIQNLIMLYFFHNLRSHLFQNVVKFYEVYCQIIIGNLTGEESETSVIHSRTFGASRCLHMSTYLHEFCRDVSYESQLHGVATWTIKIELKESELQASKHRNNESGTSVINTQTFGIVFRISLSTNINRFIRFLQR